jgi:hypothetical protein
MDLLHENTTRQLNRSLVRLRLVQVLCIIIFLGLSSTPVLSCQGQNREKALQIIYEALVAGYKMGITGDIAQGFADLEKLNKRVYALPPSCQAFVQQISDQFGGVHNPNTTRCMGGVCCDGSGCY